MKAFSVDDLHLHHKVMDLHGRPGCANVFGTVRSVDRQANGYTSRIWRFPADGGYPRPLTHGPGSDSSPRLSPDAASLAFISDRGKSRQLYVIQLDGGEARQVAEFELGVSDFRWGADGKTLLVSPESRTRLNEMAFLVRRACRN